MNQTSTPKPEGDLWARCPHCGEMTVELIAGYFPGNREEPPSYDVEWLRTHCTCKISADERDAVLDHITRVADQNCMAATCDWEPAAIDPRHADALLEQAFQRRLAVSTDWELWDTGSLPDTGLRCKHCGNEEVFSDRETALAALDGQLTCSRCGDDAPEPPYDPVAPAVITRTTERGAVFSTFPLTYESMPLLEMTVTNANRMSTASLLLSMSDAAVLYHALDAWLNDNAPEFLSSLDPMGDSMGDNR
jgi:predicted RNA-binding Zn-ribbon protein involved in translation (DUF1610 family)